MVLVTASLYIRLILPSTWIRTVAQHYPAEFDRRFGAGTHRLREFWSGFMNNRLCKQWAQSHPYLRGKEVGDLVCTVPCTVHTDAGPCTKGASCNCVSWAGLLAQGDEKITHFLSYSHLKRDSRGARTLLHAARRLRFLRRDCS